MAPRIPFSPLPADLDDVTYEFGPDSAGPAPDIAGETVEFELTESRVYPGTVRRVWVHLPVDRSGPLATMIFADGWWYLDPDGDVRAAQVLDNLVAKGDIPPLVGVFVDPGVVPADGGRRNRNAEYDTFDGRYAEFLETEVLPRVAELVDLSPNADRRGICGGSSGANAALIAAWQRPDLVQRVIGFNSSFAQIPGGDPFPSAIASTPRRPLRIFLQAAQRDLGWGEPTDNWFAESLTVAAALSRAGYDLRLVVGDGGHSPNHGGVLLPDALRWLWRGAHPARA
jgi:enterochelin esterase-like enzyme